MLFLERVLNGACCIEGPEASSEAGISRSSRQQGSSAHVVSESLVIDEGSVCHPVSGDGFAYMWGVLTHQSRSSPCGRNSVKYFPVSSDNQVVRPVVYLRRSIMISFCMALLLCYYYPRSD